MSRRRVIASVVVAAVLALGVGCGKNEQPPPASTGVNLTQETGPGGGAMQRPGGAGDGAAEAEQMFMTVCATCHGPDGSGNGPAAEALNPKPRNYTDAAWQASVTDDDIKAIIVKGGQAVGKSQMMPPNPSLASKPETLDGLVKIIRGFGKP